MKKSALIFLVLLYGCVKDKPVVATAPAAVAGSQGSVFTVDEGNYGSGNGGVSLYDPGSGAVTENYYKAVNNAGAGDVVQSISFINGSFYVVVNNSGKIIVCDAEMKKKSESTGLRSPRHITPVSFSKAYVTDLHDNAVSVVDLAAGAVVSKIRMPGWSEAITVLYNKAYITNETTDYVYIVNTITDVVEDSIYGGRGAGSVVCDAHDRVWILASGDVLLKKGGSLSRFDPRTKKTEVVATFPYTEDPSSLNISAGRDTLYFLNNGVCRMSVDGVYDPVPYIKAAGRNFYGLSVSPWNTLYLADALDYIQRSQVYVYDMSGSLKTQFRAGINTNGFYFR